MRRMIGCGLGILGLTMAPMGCLPGDLNEDGLMDLLVYYWGRTPIAFLHRDTGACVAVVGGKSPDAAAAAAQRVVDQQRKQ